MTSLNRILLMGRVGTKPYLGTSKNGRLYCRLSLATSSWNSKSDQEKRQITWHQIHVFGAQAESCAKYLDKGKEVFIEGHLQNSMKEMDGEKKWRTWISADEVTFLTKQKNLEVQQTQEEADS